MAVLVQRPQTVDFSVTKVMRFLRKQTSRAFVPFPDPDGGLLDAANCVRHLDRVQAA